MFNWFKKKEIATIALLEARLSDAIKIANSKRIVKCNHKGCIDWENGTCSLPEVRLTFDDRRGVVKCAEITESIAADMEAEMGPVKFVITSND